MSDPIALGADDAGNPLKEAVRHHLDDLEVPYTDYTDSTAPPEGETDVDYPDVALRVAHAVADGTHQRGILVCGTGIGMAIAANKVPGVYAAQAHDTYSAERARASNNAQVLTMGARVIGAELAKHIVTAWLDTEFGGGASARKVGKIQRFETSRQA